MSQPDDLIAPRVVGQMEQWRLWHWAALFFVCLLPAVACAWWRPISSDEQFTFEIARQKTVGDVWSALRSGADFHPPLDFLLRHLSMSLFGENEVAFRLPSMLATWLMLLCVFSFTARRSSAIFGFIAALIPLSTPIFEFAYDGRAYALMVAFAAAALVAWQRRAEGSRLALVLLPASLAALVWSHYYGALAFVPIAVGEFGRTLTRRRIDWPFWTALAVAGAALLPLLPFVQAARRFGGAYWTKVGILQAVTIYSTMMERLCIPAAMILAVLLATRLSARARGGARYAPSYEIAAVVGFLLLPLAAYVLAKSVTGALVTRYVLITGIGIAIGLALAAWEFIGSSAPAALVVASGLAISALGGEAAFAWKQRHLRGELDRDDLAQVVRDLPGPLVMTDNDLLMQLWHYVPPPLGRRLVFVKDDRAALEIQGYNTIEGLFPRLAIWSPKVNVQEYADFTRQNPEFVLIDDLPGYLATLLWRDGATLTAKTSYRNKWVFHVKLR